MHRPQWIPSRADLPGLGLAAALGIASTAAARALPPSPLVSDVLIGMILGALVLNTPLRRVVGLEPPSIEREPDRWAHGLRYTGKWLLRIAIVIMGMKVQTGFFGRGEILLIAIVAAASVPTAFFSAHVFGALAGVRRPLADCLAAGTMICGASAVNATAPVVGARREEQGLAIGVIFLFSVVAMLTFRAIANVVGLDEPHAGLWAGLAVNDLSSAVAVGAQMGETTGSVMAAAAKSARILLLGPMLITFSLLRQTNAKNASMKKSIVEALPGFLVGYVALAIVRATGDRLFGDAAAWKSVIDANKLLLDVLMSTVSAGIGLHLSIRAIIATSGRAVLVAGGTATLMAALTLAMIATWQRGSPFASVAIGGVALAAAWAAWRGTRDELRDVRRRFESGEPVAIAEATALLESAERTGKLDDAFVRRVVRQLSPSIGELIPARTTPLAHGEGCRWCTYWEGKSGWALVAIVRDPGAATPIHAHPHRMLGKAIEGRLEELRFREVEENGGEIQVELVSRGVLAHNELVETDGLATLHVVRAVGETPSIDLQLRGPEVGSPGRRVRVREPLDVDGIAVGARVRGTIEIDDRPGHGGEGASVGRWEGAT
ncbi:MAG TPA: putative sulfate exporter family transporter [Labilithrix sp.]